MAKPSALARFPGFVLFASSSVGHCQGTALRNEAIIWMWHVMEDDQIKYDDNTKVAVDNDQLLSELQRQLKLLRS